jgi:two-component system nitrate/nitrite response regulator NarL
MTMTTTERTRLFLMDDHQLFREGLLRLLASDALFEIVGSSGNAEEALKILKTEPVDVLILDYDLGGQTAVEFTARLKENGFAGRILVVTAGLPDRDAMQLISSGISGIFHKQDSPEALQRSIQEVANGRVLIEQKYLQALAKSTQPTANGAAQFTERERFILRSLLQGLSNKEIADKQQTSESAVKASLQQLFNKLGVRTRSQLVLLTLDRYRSQL